MLMLQTRINRKYGEYIALMNFLSETEMDLLQLVNLSDKRFWKVYSHIYNSTNTHDFGEVILKIRNNYAKHSNKLGRYTIRYILLNLTTLIISKKPGNTGISRDIRTEFTTDLLLSD